MTLVPMECVGTPPLDLYRLPGRETDFQHPGGDPDHSDSQKQHGGWFWNRGGNGRVIDLDVRERAKGIGRGIVGLNAKGKGERLAPVAGQVDGNDQVVVVFWANGEGVIKGEG